MNILKKVLLISIFLFSIITNSHGAKFIKFLSVSWTGVTIKTELAGKIVEALGYRSSNTVVSVPILYKALANGDGDIFFGNWMPSMDIVAGKYFKEGSVVKYAVNMDDAKYTLAVPSYVYFSGLQNFSDIKKYGDKLNHRIYGIEEGNDGNKIISKMIKNDMFHLKGFKLIPSSELGMVSQVKSMIDENKWILFLGWSPHYMNAIMDIRYLSGSTAETFGENDGTSTIYTNIRKGFDEENKNIAKFLKQYRFKVEQMNEIMKMIHLNKNIYPEDAGLIWVSKHPEIYKKWLSGVSTIDGKNGIEAFQAFLIKNDK